MNIMITGASGLIGQALVKALASKHRLCLVGRKPTKLKKYFAKPHQIMTWQELHDTADNPLRTYDVVINLAGENIGDKRWSKQQKQTILTSRVDPTRTLAKLCANLGNKAPRLFNASAIGIYGLEANLEQQNAKTFTETHPLTSKPKDFIAQVGHAWENELTRTEQAGVNVIKLRFGVVLSKRGGALKKILPSFLFGLGATLGSGQQPMSWVALPDVVAAIEFLLADKNAEGAYNIVADEIITQKTFAQTLAKVLNRPCLLTMPGFVVSGLFGEMAKELLLNGQRVTAQRLQDAEFCFQYKTLLSALEHSINSGK